MDSIKLCRADKNRWVVLSDVSLLEPSTGPEREKRYRVKVFVPYAYHDVSLLTYEVTAKDLRSALRTVAALNYQRSCLGDEEFNAFSFNKEEIWKTS